ncbi:hypothetical protein BDR26DRAFT_841105 [Obelidium mucronatum]|nr:hypothetical protein BDR26DRAFT_940092 [Obelidium mucronatum]KAI9331708.1 hypothetical protein BDR26DRAFT_841105 [Obelidium mucronatum]
MIGRALSIAFEATLVSTAFAGALRTSGTVLNEKKIENDTVRGLVHSYIGVGEWVLDTAASQMKKNPDYFRKA